MTLYSINQQLTIIYITPLQVTHNYLYNSFNKSKNFKFMSEYDDRFL